MIGAFQPSHIPRLQERGHLGIKCGLENIHALLGGLGRPDAGFPVILIAGTNGKGSTGAFLAHMLHCLLYTSPSPRD